MQGVLQSTFVTLPFKSEDSNELDWGYMEQYVSHIEDQYAKCIHGHLSTLGYVSDKDTIISDEDEKVILRHDQAVFKEFCISELFEIKTSKKKFNAQSIDFEEKGFPYVARSTANNGVRGHTSQDIQFLNEGNTISFGQDTATIFYQSRPYFTGDKIKILSPKFDRFNSINAQYFITVMRKSFSNFSCGSILLTLIS